jgi:hypothetical protein
VDDFIRESIGRAKANGAKALIIQWTRREACSIPRARSLRKCSVPRCR